MKKALVSIMMLALGVVFSWGEPRQEKKLADNSHKLFALSMAGGYFFAQDEVLREIYGKSVPFFSPRLSFRFPIQGHHGIGLSLASKFIQSDGKTSYTKEDISLRIQSLSLSGYYSYELRRFDLFIGTGLDFVIYKETYAETFPIDSFDGREKGFHVTAGASCHLSSAFSLRGYFQYCVSETENPGFRVNLGGTEWGLGLVYRFYF